MRKIILSVTIALIANVASFAQVTKQVVNIEEFSFNNNFSRSEVNIVRNNVIKSLQATKRIIVVDLLQQSAVKAEAERRKSEAAMNDEHDVADITQLNANFLIKGTLNSIETKQKTGKGLDGNMHTIWETELSYTIQVIDPSTGATQNTYTYTSSATSSESAPSSRSEAISGSSANMKRFVDEAFPVKGCIVQIANGDSKKAKTVYINLGNDQGIQKGQKFIVYAVIEIAGEMSEKEIGSLTAVEVMGAARTLCKVNEGGNDIANYMASNVEMTIKTRAKKEVFGGALRDLIK